MRENPHQSVIITGEAKRGSLATRYGSGVLDNPRHSNE